MSFQYTQTLRAGPSPKQSWWIRCYTLLIFKDTILTEEQIKASPEGARRGAAYHDFFVRRYNIDIWKSSHK